MKEPYYLVKCELCEWQGNSTELDGVHPPDASSPDDWIDVCPECYSKHLQNR